MHVAPILSQLTVIGDLIVIPISVSSDLIHTSSWTVVAILLYLDSVLDRDTIVCFLDAQETNESTR